jgi:hypothetical protein
VGAGVATVMRPSKRPMKEGFDDESPKWQAKGSKVKA